MLQLVTERDSALELVGRIQQRVADLFGPEAADLDSMMMDLQVPSKGMASLNARHFCHLFHQPLF